MDFIIFMFDERTAFTQTLFNTILKRRVMSPSQLIFLFQLTDGVREIGSAGDSDVIFVCTRPYIAPTKVVAERQCIFTAVTANAIHPRHRSRTVYIADLES